MKTTLLIMAAGLGSRYGGNKQIDRIGPHGEILMEYSIYDALQAGFDKVVFVIRKSMDEIFRQMIGDKIAKKVEVHYAYQEYDSLPAGFEAPAERTKPYGTVHAVLVAKDVIHEPFAVINADDYYGKDAFQAMADCLHRMQNEREKASMVAYYLKNTVLPMCNTDLGSTNLVSHNKLLSNAVNTTGYNRRGEASGCASSFAWEDTKICALSEVQVYGAAIWSSSGFDTGEACRQLEVFQKYSHTEIFGNEYPWLRDVVSASYAASDSHPCSVANHCCSMR